MTCNLKFFIDFDGTITQNDVVDMILERFASAEWKKIEAEWVSGRIGSRECLSRQMALVEADRKAFDRLLDEVRVDESFAGFVMRLGELSIPAFIVSDGFDFVIHSVLKRFFNSDPELRFHLPVFSNKLDWVSDRPQVSFSQKEPCAHGCANCKEMVIQSLNTSGDKVIFVGDGLSDRFAARIAHFTFAKGKLLDFCETNKIDYKPYSGFKDIEEWVLKLEMDAARQ